MKRVKRVLSAVFIMYLLMIVFGICTVYAQGDTRINIRLDKDNYNIGDTFKVYVEGQNVVDMFGLQFTLEYDPSKLEVQGDGMELLGGYQSFGGVTVDKEKGILTYPVINSESTTELVETEQVGYVTFKALQEGSTMLTLTNIKAVNTNSKEIQYNTQTQKLLNISKTPTGSDSGQDPKPIESQDSEPSNSGGNNTSTDNPDTTAPGSSSDQNSDNSVGNQSDNNDSLSSDVDNNADVPGDNEDSNTGNQGI